MSVEYIDIDPTQVPYQFDIQLAGITYTFDIKYNNVGEFFTADLYRQKIPVAYGEKIVYGKPMFSPKTQIVNNKTVIVPQYASYPKLIILPYDTSKKENKVTYDNLGSTVFLYVRTEADLNV